MNVRSLRRHFVVPPLFFFHFTAYFGFAAQSNVQGIFLKASVCVYRKEPYLYFPLYLVWYIAIAMRQSCVPIST